MHIFVHKSFKQLKGVKMDKAKKSIGVFIIASAIIWGAVIIGCSLKLKGTGCFDEISNILIVGAGFHLLFIWGPLAIQLKKTKKKE
jgi:hypothetical protein